MNIKICFFCIQEIQAIIEHNRVGFRKQVGTKLLNERTGEVVYTPAQDHDQMIELMTNLEHFITARISLNNLFSHPYTKIEYIMNDLQVSRATAVKYLEELVKLNLLMKQKIGRDSYYMNKSLFDVLIRSNS